MRYVMRRDSLTAESVAIIYRGPRCPQGVVCTLVHIEASLAALVENVEERIASTYKYSSASDVTAGN